MENESKQKDNLKQLLYNILHPRGWALFLFYVLAIILIATSILLAVFDLGLSIFAYIIYGLSAIALTYMIYTIVYFSPKIKKRVIAFANKYEFTNNLLKNFGFRTLVFAGFSFAFNCIYAISLGVFAIYAHSIWYGSLAAYYIFLSFLRGGVILSNLKTKHKKGQEEYATKRIATYKNCGIVLILMTIVFSISILQIIIADGGFRHAGLMIYVFSAYTFYKITLSIINIIKASKKDEFLVQSIRNINFSDALISILALQTAMFTEFGSDFNHSTFNALTGSIVCILIIALGIYMIVKAKTKLKQIKNK